VCDLEAVIGRHPVFVLQSIESTGTAIGESQCRKALDASKSNTTVENSMEQSAVVEVCILLSDFLVCT